MINVRKKDWTPAESGELADKNHWNYKPVPYPAPTHICQRGESRNINTIHKIVSWNRWFRLRRSCKLSVESVRSNWKYFWEDIARMFLILSTIFTVFLNSLAASISPDMELQLLHVVKFYFILSETYSEISEDYFSGDCIMIKNTYFFQRFNTFLIFHKYTIK